jgi:hypothetical protein
MGVRNAGFTIPGCLRPHTHTGSFPRTGMREFMFELLVVSIVLELRTFMFSGVVKAIFRVPRLSPATDRFPLVPMNPTPQILLLPDNHEKNLRVRRVASGFSES